MTENMKKFLELVSKDEELCTKINTFAKEEIISTAKDLGIELHEADFAPTSQLSDDELDVITGGGDCYCLLGGGGSGKKGENTVCACAIYGQGDSYEASCRCICINIGDGYDD